MDFAFGELVGFLKRPAVAETLLDVLLCAVPIWVAVMIGLVIGWSWRPRWSGLLFLGLRSRFRLLWAPPGFGARRLWLAFTALSAFSVCRRLWCNFKGKDVIAAGEAEAESPAAEDRSAAGSITTSGTSPEDNNVVTEKDLEHLLHLLDGKLGDAGWQHQMERSTANMTYQAWRYEPEEGPVVYRSRTVFDDATPELIRDFFWDDDFRLKWDHMLAHFKVLEESHDTGMMIVHWIKKFPFFCSDREYIIGRRIWESGKTYYCVTKGVPYPGIRKNEKPRRVELYFSSWCIRPVESRKQDGQFTACEVTLVHYEDMGIPKDVAKVGVRHGMWGAVKKLQSGVRAYQLARRSDAPLSRTALMAQVTTRISADGVARLGDSESGSEDKNGAIDAQKLNGGVDWKLMLIGGTVVVICGLQTGVIGKAFLLGAARRLARK
ncbi:hypothetical protein QJS04_geneDACA013125 [Acorus gramineus]|uniref:START domain-containing protein n=1 Tax=Acorus gramineus TaxID=55184 RepID=A0AAV9B3H8_ACOGR|nr:hypothetical protein QJS04_geneDACA013125 [Acorus gramineus]